MQHWYLVHTKPRQELVAAENLERQGYPCFLPRHSVQRVVKGRLQPVLTPLFPRYLFISLDDGFGARSWAPIRSTLGVSRLISFGKEPAKVSAELIELIRERCIEANTSAVPMFLAGDRVQIASGPFAGVDAIFQETDDDKRVMVLIEIMSRTVALSLEPAQVRKDR